MSNCSTCIHFIFSCALTSSDQQADPVCPQPPAAASQLVPQTCRQTHIQQLLCSHLMRSANLPGVPTTTSGCFSACASATLDQTPTAVSYSKKLLWPYLIRSANRPGVPTTTNGCFSASASNMPPNKHTASAVLSPHQVSQPPWCAHNH
jgi:hypothetical protein